MLVKILLVLLVLSWIYLVAAYLLARVFFTQPRKNNTSFTPPVSILKPVRGMDFQAYQNFASFCEQDYPEFELLFGVSDPNDPVIPQILRLQQEFPGRRISLIIHEADEPNHKAGLLHELASRARYDVLAASDADIRVAPDYLRRVVAPLQEERIGLVTCPYRGEIPLTFTARLEALHMGVTFLPSVLVARKVLKMRFALGATNVLRRRDLERIGGYEALASYLADDYQIGNRIARTGLHVALSDSIVISILGATTFKTQWDRELRWAHCNRISRPLEYPGYALSFTLPWAALLVLVSGAASWAWGLLIFSLALRWSLAWAITGLTGDAASRRWLFWLPVRDGLSALIWCAGFVGKTVTWRDETFFLNSEGQLIPQKNVKVGRKWDWL